MFLFSLATHLHMPVGELLRRMDSRELTEWMAFFAVRSKDNQRADMNRQSTALSAQAKVDLNKQMKGK